MSASVEEPTPQQIAEVQALIEADAALIAVLEQLGGLERLEIIQETHGRTYGAHDLVTVMREVRRWAVAHGMRPPRPSQARRSTGL